MTATIGRKEQTHPVKQGSRRYEDDDYDIGDDYEDEELMPRKVGITKQRHRFWQTRLDMATKTDIDSFDGDCYRPLRRCLDS